MLLTFNQAPPGQLTFRCIAHAIAEDPDRLSARADRLSLLYIEVTKILSSIHARWLPVAIWIHLA